MLATLHSMLVFAQETGSGRGENPGDGGGIAIILGVIAAVVVTLVVVGLLLRSRSRKAAETAPESVEHRPGGVGRVRGSG